MAQPGHLRILLSLAGIRRNLEETPPGRRIREDRGLEAFGRELVAVPGGDEKAEAVAEHLVKSQRRRDMAIVHVPPRKSDCPVPADFRDRTDGVRAAFEASVRDIVDRFVGGRLEGATVVVSTLSGRPEHWTLYLEALEEAGVDCAMIVEVDGGLREVKAGPAAGSPRAPTVAEHLRHLERLPSAGVVLLTGPTGAGKTRFARQLHRRWYPEGQKRPFEAINCSALPGELVESVLFGHAKGAFTGAVAASDGAFKKAHGGTLFLDEVGELAPAAQAKLLTALDVQDDGRRHFQIVGGGAASSSLRLVVGTNRDLAALVASSRFRLDLLARLSTHEVELPPLWQAPHRIPGAYLDQLQAQSKAFSTPGTAVRFTMHRPVLGHLLALASRHDPTAFVWNHRDIVQSAERIALATWNAHFVGKKRPDPAAAQARGRKDLELTISDATLVAELSLLRERWRRLAPASPDAAPAPSAEVLAMFGEPAVADWSLAQRVEGAAAQRSASEHPSNAAEAYRAWVRRMYPDRGDERLSEVTNPSKAWKDLLARLGHPAARPRPSKR